MPKRKLTNLFFYRRRVALAYLLIAVSLGAALTIALFIPGGVTPAERASAVTAMSAGFTGVNAPYYLLQRASLSVFGLSTVGIKLPSVVLGGLLGIVLFLLLRRWVRLVIAVFGALIIFSGVTFLSLTGTGSPVILYVLHPALLVYFGTRVLAHDRGLVVYALLLLVSVGLALLTPTMIYLVALAIGLAAFNPHVRYGFRRLPLYGKALLALGLAAALAPVALTVLADPSRVWTILAVPATVTPASVLENVRTLALLYGGFLRPGLAAGMITPVVGLATAGLATLGLYRIIRAIYTARAQFIVGWSVIALVIAVIDPGFGILLYLPAVLLAGIGLGQLASIWYRTFPLNPYARVTALLPIGVLIGAIVFGSTSLYANTTLYASGSAELYSRDLQVLRTYAANARPQGRVTLLVSDNLVPFYTGLTIAGRVHERAPFVAVEQLSSAADTVGPLVSSQALEGRGTPTRILTDGRTDQADRFYVYE